MVLRQLPLLLRGVAAAPFVTALCRLLATTPDPDREREAFLHAFAAHAVPLLPSIDTAGGEQLLRELDQLLRDGGLGESEFPWLPLSAERLAALFAARG